VAVFHEFFMLANTVDFLGQKLRKTGWF